MLIFLVLILIVVEDGLVQDEESEFNKLKKS